ncbi:MAG: ABC transporter permease subunit [Candidatus Poribacteria bacterium]|nr:ABC transporter permease subunit [Candidatus Poribacteria bacterium]
MIWHIAKRELYDNLNSLRFALATVLLFGLMLTNAIVHLREHPVRIQKYHDAVTESLNRLRARTDLYEIAQWGPGNLYKKPSPLHFCAEGGDIFLSDRVNGEFVFWTTDDLRGFWQLLYLPATLNSKNIRPDTIKVDWGFVIGYVLSLIAILFTFDSISGERERGTLRLMLANSVPRHTVLLGKFLGALISISVPFTLSVLMNLLVISTSNDVQLSTEAWSRLGIIFSIALLYLCLFLALGLLVSSRVQQNAASLVTLLLMWVTFVVFMPSTLASIASGFSTPMTYDEFFERRNQLHNELKDTYETRLQNTDELSAKKIQLGGEYVTDEAAQRERLSHEHLNQEHAQIQLARSVTRISPVAIVQHLLEAFAGTGFERHRQFVENVQRYAREYREFVGDMDRADPDSPHIIGVREGMSQKPINPEAIPKFEDTLSLSRDFNTAAVDLLLLVLFFLVFFSGAYLAFVRVEV